MLKLSAERVIVAGFVAAVPPLTVVVNSVLFTATNCAEADANSSPAIVISPDLPAIPVSLPLTEKIDEGGVAVDQGPVLLHIRSECMHIECNIAARRGAGCESEKYGPSGHADGVRCDPDHAWNERRCPTQYR
jgi:hypothetical protein